MSDVQASLQYLLADDAKPVLHASVGGGDTTQHSAAYEATPVTIHDGRVAETPFSLEREGFALVAQETAVEDFYDKAQIAEPYEAEVVALVKRVTGASHVHVFDHTLRADAQATQAARGIREPAWFVHNDYTARSAARRVRDLMPAEVAEARLSRRFAVINVWRPVRGPVESTPLAVCDAQSVAEEDIVVSERRAKDRIGEIQLATFNPRHRWHYFPHMTRDEVLLIKTYDSAPGAQGRSTIHAAFEDPTTPPGAPPRESIETRTFAFF
ncbi:MAG: CmcJ/NvfI family oxidoreductase [Pseudomonadota bacterium]